jgi:hypothetical protein
MQQELCNSIKKWARYKQNTGRIYIDVLCKVLWCVDTGVLDARAWCGCVDAYVSFPMQQELCNSMKKWSRYDQNTIYIAM